MANTETDQSMTLLERFSSYLERKYGTPEGIDILSEWLIFSRQNELSEEETAELHADIIAIWKEENRLSGPTPTPDPERGEK